MRLICTVHAVFHRLFFLQYLWFLGLPCYFEIYCNIKAHFTEVPFDFKSRMTWYPARVSTVQYFILCHFPAALWYSENCTPPSNMWVPCYSLANTTVCIQFNCFTYQSLETSNELAKCRRSASCKWYDVVWQALCFYSLFSESVWSNSLIMSILSLASSTREGVTLIVLWMSGCR